MAAGMKSAAFEGYGIAIEAGEQIRRLVVFLRHKKCLKRYLPTQIW